MRGIKLAPSILNADFSDLREALSIIESTADLIHLDVMDGDFVPNITFGPVVVEAVRRLTGLPLDTHLMISHPEKFVPDFVSAGADWVSFHAELEQEPDEILELIHSYGRRAGMVVNPGTPPSSLYPYLEMMDFALVMTVQPGWGGQKMRESALSKVSGIKEEAARLGTEIEVEVDGGINTGNLDLVMEAGTDIVVVGSSIYNAADPRKAALDIRKKLDRFDSA